MGKTGAFAGRTIALKWLALLSLLMTGCTATNPGANAGAVAEAGTSESRQGPQTVAPLPNTVRQIHVEQEDPAADDRNPGSVDAPLRTIQRAMQLLQAGDDVIVGPGIYRETIVVPAMQETRYSTVIRARVPGTVVVKGSDLVSGWIRSSPDTWVTSWEGKEPEQIYRAGAALKQIGGTVFGGYPEAPGHPLASLHRREGGIWPGRTAGGAASLTADSFTYAQAEGRVYIRLSRPLKDAEALEVSTRSYVLRAESAIGLIVDGIVFEHSNTSLKARHGAVFVAGRANTIRNLVVRDMDSFCVMLDGDDSALLDSTIERCGQAGVAAYGRRVMVSGNSVTANNTRGFNKNWEAGGMKFTGTPALMDSTVSDNIVAYNNGDGIWFDWTPRRITVSGNVVAYNAGHGIQFEASQFGNIVGNFAYGNRLRGIYLLESSDSEVAGNSVFGNGFEGIAIADGARSSANPALLPLRNSIKGNSIAWNDAGRNRLQLMLPGLAFAARSDRNVFQATDRLPRYAQGWLTLGNAPFSSLSAWRQATGQDGLSTEGYGPIPPGLSDTLARRLIVDPETLPFFLRSAGVH